MAIKVTAAQFQSQRGTQPTSILGAIKETAGKVIGGLESLGPINARSLREAFTGPLEVVRGATTATMRAGTALREIPLQAAIKITGSDFLKKFSAQQLEKIREIDEELIKKAETVLPPSKRQEVGAKIARKVGEFVPSLLGGVAAERVVATTLPKVLPKVAASKVGKKVVDVVAETVGWQTMGQIDFKPKDETRAQAAVETLAAQGLFKAGAFVLKPIAKPIFESAGKIGKTIFDKLKNGKKLKVSEVEQFAAEIPTTSKTGATIGAAPYRGVSYEEFSVLEKEFNKPEFKQFGQDIENRAKQYALYIDKNVDSAGIWKDTESGKILHEPSKRVEIKQFTPEVDALASELGQIRNQQAMYRANYEVEAPRGFEYGIKFKSLDDAVNFSKRLPDEFGIEGAALDKSSNTLYIGDSENTLANNVKRLYEQSSREGKATDAFRNPADIRFIGESEYRGILEKSNIQARRGVSDVRTQQAEITPPPTTEPTVGEGGFLISPPPQLPALKQPLPEEATGRELNLRIIKNIVKDVEEKNAQTVDPVLREEHKRLFLRVSERLETGEYLPEDVIRIFEKRGLIPTEIARDWKESISLAGKKLNVLSQLSKTLDETLKTAPPEMKAVVDKMLNDAKRAVEENTWARFNRAFSRVEHTRRGLLVTQLATSMRNVLSQSARYNLNIIEDTMMGVAETITGKRPAKEAFAYAVEDIAAIFRRLRPSKRKQLESLLDSVPEEAIRLLSKPGEVALDQRLVALLNVVNTGQEHYFRKLVFDARIHAIAKQMKIADLTKLPQEAYERAVDDALELTFAKTPKRGEWGFNFYQKMKGPWATALFNPFPRFMVNGQKFLIDYNPLGFARLLSPKFLKEILSKDSEKAYRAMARATLGTFMLGGALAIRNNPDWRGEKWYEIKSGSKRYDMRPFAPFAQYLFLAEVMREVQGEKTTLESRDFAEAAISINRIAGTGLALIDLFRNVKPENAENIIKKILGTWMSGFSVPFRTVKDFIAAFDQTEAQVRDIRERPITGPTLRNIPILGPEVLPPSPTITRGVPFEAEAPIQRQLTGLQPQTRTPLEAEINRLGINTWQLYPRTTIPELDRLISAEAGKKIRTQGEKLVKSIKYKKAGEEEKEEMIRDLIKEEKADARKVIFAKRPDLKKKYKNK